MLRAPSIFALVLSVGVLASAGAAQADDCMCALVELGWDDGLAHPGLEVHQNFEGHQSIEVGPFFSSDGTMLSSRVRSSLEHARPSSAPVEEVLWCASPDDPRCSPREQGPENGPHASDATRAGLTEAVQFDPEAEAVGSIGSTSGLPLPSDGVRFRVDRPPRS